MTTWTQEHGMVGLASVFFSKKRGLIFNDFEDKVGLPCVMARCG